VVKRNGVDAVRYDEAAMNGLRAERNVTGCGLAGRVGIKNRGKNR
jgi:hypothetical protein